MKLQKLRVVLLLVSFFLGPINQVLAAGEPSITTGSASGITGTLATLIATVTDEGSSTPTLQGFEYGLDTNYGSSVSQAYTSAVTYDSQITTGSLSYPVGIGIDSSDNIYVGNQGASAIPKYNSSGTFLSNIATSGSGDGFVNQAYGIAIDDSDNVFVLDTYNRRIQKFNSSGTYQLKFGSAGTGNGQFGSYSHGIAIDGSGNIFYADNTNHRVQKFDSSGNYVSQFGSSGSGNGQFTNPVGIAFDSSGNIFVVGQNGTRVQKFDSSGNYVSQFGSSGSGNGQFNTPYGIAIDSADNIYVVDGGNHRVQKFDSSGNYVSQFGSSGSGNGQFSNPRGIAIDSSGDIYVVDTYNQRIQKFNVGGFSPMNLTGLTCNTTYHYRAFLTNSNGTGYGSDSTFTTEACSTSKAITAFTIAGNGTVNEGAKTIAVNATDGADITNLTPTITVSSGATVSPASGVAQDFTNPVTYTVTAEDDSTQDYLVTVTLISEVLVLYNSDYATDSNSDSVQDSLEIANYYKTKRSIPDGNVIGVSAPVTEVISRAQMTTLVSTIETAITNAGLEDSIKYIVLTKGMPLKILPTSGSPNVFAGDHASVDSSLTILYSSLVGSGKNVNPYYTASDVTDLSHVFTQDTFDLGGGEYLKFLVTRLDGYTVSDVKAMIDRAYNADTSGTGYFVLDGLTNLGAVDSMSLAVTALTNLNKNVTPNPFVRATVPISTISGSVIGYVGYGKNGGQSVDYFNNTLDFTYLNGAVASTYESFNNWGYTQDPSLYDSHGQIAEFIESGGTGALGHVYEPFSVAIAQEKIWMTSYAAGYNWAEAAYMSMPYLDWQNVVTGDPLMKIVADGLSTPTVTSGSSSSVTPTTATLGGNITALGGENNIVRGIQYGTTDSYGSTSSESGNFSTGAFTINLTDLICNTTYHYRAYSTNSFRTGYGSDSTFNTSACVSPSVTTGSASSVTNTTSTLGGTIVDVGVANPTIRGFEYGITTNYGSVVNESGSFTASAYTLGVTGLACNTTYHFRAYATNSNGTTYGDDAEFTTLYSCTPTITTVAESNVLVDSATLNGTITDSGNETITVRGFDYGATSSYGTTTTESGSFASELGYITEFGSSGSGDGQFNSPRDVAVDSSGNIYVADRLNHRIQKFDSDGVYITKWGSSGSGNGQFSYPRGIAIDSNDNIYVTDSDNHRVQKFDSDGVYITKWGSYGSGNGNLSYPQDIVIDSDDNIYVSDYDNSRITKFTSAGVYITKWGSAGSGNGQFNPAYSLAVDSSDNIYVADKSNHRIQKFDSDGTYITQFGNNGTGNGQFASPSGIAIDSSDNIYVTDGGNRRIQKFGSNHLYITEFGSSGSGNKNFNAPEDLTFDSSGNMYVADYSNHRIQKFGGSNIASFNIVLTGLSCGTTYHFRPYGTNISGIGYGSDDTFTTSDCDPVVSVVSSSSSSGSSGSSRKLPTSVVPIVLTNQLKPINIPIIKVHEFTKSSLIRKGSKGEAVITLQTFLKAQGPSIYPADEPVDGIFGPKTDKAVKNFQALNNLKVDGIVGPNTKLAMDTLNTSKYCFVPVTVVTC